MKSDLRLGLAKAKVLFISPLLTSLSEAKKLISSRESSLIAVVYFRCVAVTI